MKKPVILYLIMLLFPFHADAKIYKCVEESGEITFSNKPCPNNTDTEEVESLQADNRIFENQSPETIDSDGGSVFKDNESKGEFFEKIKHISSGERVDIETYIEPEKYTVFMFYAPWCPSCRKVRPQIQAMANNSFSIALREIDIVEWGSPVASQYRIKSIPYFLVFDTKGNLIENGSRISSQLANKIR